ncbi:unnamed protein product [Polarella glacialis]|uniref:Uncharacterized protein n=1 Tax=Polarella glacialis TaxID=89957 RepID=A0A813I2Z7_POLGL|nr:unnamed protein product [Polarella glacialis]
MLFVRAARVLEAGDEITDGYISVLQLSWERRKKLLARHGFGLSDDRAVVEDALLPESLARPLLDRLDSAEEVEDFQRLTGAAEELVRSRLTWLGEGRATPEVEAAATRLGPGLERLLLGGLAAAAYVAVAVVSAQLGEHARAAAAYAHCCWLMEELAPHNAYHASWAVEALLEAARGGLPVQGYVRYARKVLESHCGPGALEAALLARSRSNLQPDQIAASEGWQWCPPGEPSLLCETYQEGGQCMLVVKVEVDERLASEDLEVSTSRLVVRLRLRSKWLSVMLPCRVRADAAGPVRLSKLGRSLRISLPMD